MENLRLDRENTGNLKMQFEWVPCITVTDLKGVFVSQAGPRQGYNHYNGQIGTTMVGMGGRVNVNHVGVRATWGRTLCKGTPPAVYKLWGKSYQG